MVMESFWSKVEKLVGKDPIDKIKSILNGINDRSKEIPYINSKVRPLLALFEEHEIDQGLLYEKLTTLITALEPIRKEKRFLISEKELKELEGFYEDLKEKTGPYVPHKKRMEILLSLNPIYKKDKKLRNFLLFNWDIIDKMRDYSKESRDYFIANYPSQFMDLVKTREDLLVMLEIIKAAHEGGYKNSGEIVMQMIISQKKLVRNREDLRRVGLLFASPEWPGFSYPFENRIFKSVDDIELFSKKTNKILEIYTESGERELIRSVMHFLRPNLDELDIFMRDFVEKSKEYTILEVAGINHHLKNLAKVFGDEDVKVVPLLFKPLGEFRFRFISIHSLLKGIYEYQDLWGGRKENLLGFIDVIKRTNLDVVFLMKCFHYLRHIIKDFKDLEEVAVFLKKISNDKWLRDISYMIEEFENIKNKEELFNLEIILKAVAFDEYSTKKDLEILMELDIVKVEDAFSMILAKKEGKYLEDTMHKFIGFIRKNFEGFKKNPEWLDIYGEIAASAADKQWAFDRIVYGIKIYEKEIGDDNNLLREVGLLMVDFHSIIGEDLSVFRDENAHYYFCHDIPTLKLYGHAVAEIAAKSGGQYYFVFKFISKIMERIKGPEDLKEWGLPLTEIAKSMGTNLDENLVEFLIAFMNIEEGDKNRIIKLCINFLIKEVGNNRVKARYLKYISKIPQSVMRVFGQYFLYLLENSPANFMKILFNISSLVGIKAEISDEIKQFVKVCRSFRLALNEDNYSEINVQNIENTYLFLTSQMGKKPKQLDKLRKNFKKLETQHKKTALEFINKIIVNLSIEYFSYVTYAKIRGAFEKFCGVPLPSKLEGNEDAMNALLVGYKCGYGGNREFSKVFMKEVCLLNTVPFKEYPEAYPYSDPKNAEFIRIMEGKGINMMGWVKGFKGEYKPTFTDASTNIEKMIKDNRDETIEHLEQLYKEAEKEEMKKNIEEFIKYLQEASEENFDEYFKKIKDHKNRNLVMDIKGHLSAIKSLKGKHVTVTGIKKVTIFVEQDPLKVLQMGNVVSGSCLRLGGGSSWTTFTNAADVNKSVLYAVDERGNILGRRLIAMTDDGGILQFKVYNNAPEIDLDKMFENYTIELAKRCNARPVDSGNVSLLLAESWYAGTAIQPFGAKKEKTEGRIPKAA